jgi:hypothetical protein
MAGKSGNGENRVLLVEKGVVKIKNGKLLTSHRSTIYPCCLPALGEFNRSWSYKTCRCKGKGFGLRKCSTTRAIKKIWLRRRSSK